MVMIYSLLGRRAACWAGINQRVLHHWVRGLPAQDSTVGTLTYQLQRAGVVLVISELPPPQLCYPGVPPPLASSWVCSFQAHLYLDFSALICVRSLPLQL